MARRARHKRHKMQSAMTSNRAMGGVPRAAGEAEPADSAGRRRYPTVVEWLCLVGGVTLVIRYAWLLDDAYVYFRYVDNLLFLERGLVFNAGEYVEGFSSPLWILLLIAMRFTGLNYWILVRLTGVLSFVIFWGLLLVLNRRMSPARSTVLNFPLCYLAFNYGVLCYFTSGLESPLVLLTAVVYSLFVLNPRSATLQVLLACTPLIRHEFAVPFVMCLGWYWIRERRIPLRLALLGVLFTGSWVTFRVYYYADVFPNTFYLKNETNIGQGLRYVHDTAGPYGLYPIMAGLGVLASLCMAPARTEADTASGRMGCRVNDGDGASDEGIKVRERIVMLALAGALTLYVVKIGGDARHFRYLAFPFCLCLCACAGLAEHALARIAQQPLPRRTVILGVTVAVASGMLYPRQLLAHPVRGNVNNRRVDKIADAACHRFPNPRFPRFILSPLGSGEKIELKHEYQEYENYYPRCTHSDVAVESRCAKQYEAFFVRFVHEYGLTDPILARTEMEAERPAHKSGLRVLAKDLRQIVTASGETLGPGMYRHAVEESRAAPWITQNLETIETIERKMFNKHEFFENVRLAFAFPPKINPSGK